MDTLLVTRSTGRPGLMTVTLNRPEKLNAINARMHEELQYGFVDHVVPDSELMERAVALAGQLLQKDPVAVALTKSACNALAQLMVPEQPTYSDRELLLFNRFARQSRRTPEARE